MIEELAIYGVGILLALGVFTMGMFTPGPNILSVIGTSMAVGRSQGKALALGIASGSIIWGSLSLAGLTLFLSAFAVVMTALKFAGALYLLWLAFKLFRSAGQPGDAPMRKVEIDGGFWQYYGRGLTIQLTNPKAMLSWIAIMSFAIDGDAPLWVGALTVAVTGLYSIVGHLVYAVAFSTRPMVAGYRRARRGIEAGLGLFFCFASFKLATSKL